MINTIDTPKLIYPVTVLELIPELPNINDIDTILTNNEPNIKDISDV